VANTVASDSLNCPIYRSVWRSERPASAFAVNESPAEREPAEEKHAAPEWQAAMEAPILVAENGGPSMLARIRVVAGAYRKN